MEKVIGWIMVVLVLGGWVSRSWWRDIYCFSVCEVPLCFLRLATKPLNLSKLMKWLDNPTKSRSWSRDRRVSGRLMVGGWQIDIDLHMRGPFADFTMCNKVFSDVVEW